MRSDHCASTRWYSNESLLAPVGLVYNYPLLHKCLMQASVQLKWSQWDITVMLGWWSIFTVCVCSCSSVWTDLQAAATWRTLERDLLQQLETDWLITCQPLTKSQNIRRLSLVHSVTKNGKEPPTCTGRGHLTITRKQNRQIWGPRAIFGP